jgi:23S rRNA (guanosine2251-2'-O)-methyltransferase
MSATVRVHGYHAIRSLLQRSPARVLRLYVAAGRDDARADGIADLARSAACPVERVERRRLDAMSGEGVVHQGLLAEVRPLAPWTEDELLEVLSQGGGAGAAQGAGAEPRASLLLALDGVQDPHNLGACLRTADACGALAVITPRDRAAPLNATARKVAAGAAETTPTVVVTNLARCLRELKQAGLWVVGADAEAPRLAAETDLSGPLVLVMGGEGTGLRQLTRETCDLLVRLPQLGAVESLNVSVATGMLLYEAVRQRSADAGRGTAVAAAHDGRMGTPPRERPGRRG